MPDKFRIGAVSYLNAAPLIFDLEHRPLDTGQDVPGIDHNILKARWRPFLTLFLMVLTISSNGWGDARSEAIRARLDQAGKRQAASIASLSPLERDLVFFTNFERDEVAFLGNSEVIPLELEKSYFRPGKFGRCYYFEKPRHNFFPPDVADVENSIGGFRSFGGAQLNAVATDTRFGKRALSVSLPGVDAGLETAPVKVAFRLQDGGEKKVTLLASCYVKGPKEARIRIELKLLPKEPSSATTSSGKDTPVQDQTFPQEITLTGEWQRIACHVTADPRWQEREASFALKSHSPSVMTLLADGFQFEQASYYPHHHLMPTSWTPGGTAVPANFVDLNASPLRHSFPTHEGTISFWTCTPHSSNLVNQGNIIWLSFGIWWHDPQWSMGTYVFQAGDKFCYFPGSNVADGNWHHVAMTWDRTKGYAYLDGKLIRDFDRADVDLSGKLDRYRLRLGGSVNDGQAANSFMDEVAIFKRKLSDEELQQLAEGKAPLRPTANRLLLTRGQRSVFFRDETKASIEVEVRSLETQKAQPEAYCGVGEWVSQKRDLTLNQGRTTARFEFAPSQLKCGTYPCRVGVIASDGSAAYIEFPVEIVPSLRAENYPVSSWAHGGETAEWREFCRKIGVNVIDTYDTNIEELGRNGFQYGWHYNFGNGVWSPENRKAVREQTRTAAEQRGAFPNWQYTLFNSEVPHWPVPDGLNRAAWFDAWAEKELGFKLPEKGWALETCNNPIQCWFPADKKPGKDGIYQPTREFKFLKWWYNRGCGWWRINSEAAEEIKRLRPEVRIYTEPLWYPGQITDLDAGSNWSYQVAPEPLIGEFETSYATLRGSTKDFYVTLGMNYVSGDWLNVTEPDGAKKTLMPTPDDMIQQSWIAIGRLPTDGMAYWYLDGWFNGQQGRNGEYCPPDSAEKLGAALKQDLIPLGTMLKHVPNAQRPLALLLPESTLWMDAGEGGWGWGAAHFPNHWKTWLGNSGIPYDLVLDNNITPGSLAKYKVVIFPMAEYVSADVHKELVTAGNAGTKIIVDSYCRQEYPNMERWEQEYFYRMADIKRKDYGKETEKRLAELQEKLLPEMDAYAVGAEGKVLTNVREFGGVKYVSVINNNRQEGPYTKWTKNETFKPYGKELTPSATLTQRPQRRRRELQRFSESDKWLCGSPRFLCALCVGKRGRLEKPVAMDFIPVQASKNAL